MAGHNEILSLGPQGPNEGWHKSHILVNLRRASVTLMPTNETIIPFSKAKLTKCLYSPWVVSF